MNFSIQTICENISNRSPTSERAVGKKQKLGSYKKESQKLGSFHLSWKVPIEVGKFSM